MRDLTKESLVGELDKLTRIYFENRLYELFNQLDGIMKNYFEMRRIDERKSKENVLINKNKIIRSDVRFRYDVTPTQETYGSIPICNCRTYKTDNSGLVIVVKVGGVPEVIFPPFNRLYWSWYFYGDFWKKERSIGIKDTSIPCAFQSLKSVKSVYFPIQPLSYLIENFEKLKNLEKKKDDN